MNHDVRLRVECTLPARLLQQAIDAGAVFTNVRVTNRRVLTVDCCEASAAILIGLCETYHLHARVLRRRGLRTLAARVRARWTFPVGILLGICICAAVLSRVWRVEIAFTGNCADLGDRAQVLQCVESVGIAPGTRRSRIDADALGKEISAEAGKFSFVGVRTDGMILRIEAAPETPAPETYVLTTARDLAASRAGIVESVFVRSGAACVAAGETVLPGQTLIRGDERNSDDTTTPVAALGSVIARCWFEGAAESPTETVVSTRSGRQRAETALHIFGRSLPLTKCEPFAAEETETEALPVVGVFLPLEIRRTIHYETETTTVQADRSALERRLALLAMAQVRAELESAAIDYNILSEWTDVETGETGMRVRAVIEAAMDIAEPRDALN